MCEHYDYCMANCKGRVYLLFIISIHTTRVAQRVEGLVLWTPTSDPVLQYYYTVFFKKIAKETFFGISNPIKLVCKMCKMYTLEESISRNITWTYLHIPLLTQFDSYCLLMNHLIGNNKHTTASLLAQQSFDRKY